MESIVWQTGRYIDHAHPPAFHEDGRVVCFMVEVEAPDEGDLWSIPALERDGVADDLWGVLADTVDLCRSLGIDTPVYRLPVNRDGLARILMAT